MKKILSFLLGVVVMFNVVVSAQAASFNQNSSVIDGDNDQPSLNAIVISDNPIMRRDQFPSSYTISVPVCKQETSYYCGPATVQQILKFNNGTAPTQAVIARGIGTTTDGSSLSPMLPYIREQSNSGFVGYEIYKDPSIENMKYLIGATIYFDYGPPIARIIFQKTGNWPYSTNGHFLNVSGYEYGNASTPSSSSNRLRLTDPNIQRVDPTSNGTYWITLNELHTATTTARSQEFAAGAYYF